METKDYNIENDSTPMAAEPLAAYEGQSHTSHQWTITKGLEEHVVPGIPLTSRDKARAEERVQWGNDNFDRLLAEAEELNGYERGNNYTVDQYFGILRYIVEKGYEAVPED